MKKKDLRIMFPQWIGGNRFVYSFGTKMLEWMIPPTNSETLEIPIIKETDSIIEDSIAFKSELIKQTKDLQQVLKEKNPDRIVTIGGDCSISLAPFSYLLEKYKNDVGVLWLDRHGDISLTGETIEYHAMIIPSLLGYGDEDFSNLVNYKLDANKLLHVGVNDPDKEFGLKLGKQINFNNVLPSEFEHNSKLVLSFLKKMKVEKILVHFDLDVLDIISFRSQSSANPEVYFDRLPNIKPGASFHSIGRLLNDINKEYEIVGLSIAEYLPWDTISLYKLLQDLPLLSHKES